MAFSDWNKFTSNGTNLPMTATSTGPIADLQSLSAGPATGATLEEGNATAAFSGLTKGLTKGRMRGLFERTAGASTSSNGWGFAFMQSADDLTTGTPNFYYWEMLANGTLNLKKYSAANLSGSSTTLASGASAFSITTGVAFAMEVAWAYDLSEYGGIRIECYTGTMTDFSNLQLEYNVIDNSSPFSTSVAEGPAFRRHNGSVYQVLHDTTSLYSITLV